MRPPENIESCNASFAFWVVIHRMKPARCAYNQSTLPFACIHCLKQTRCAILVASDGQYLALVLTFEILVMQLEGDGNGSSPACKFTEHASNAVHGSVAEHEFDLDW